MEVLATEARGLHHFDDLSRLLLGKDLLERRVAAAALVAGERVPVGHADGLEEHGLEWLHGQVALARGCLSAAVAVSGVMFMSRSSLARMHGAKSQAPRHSAGSIVAKSAGSLVARDFLGHAQVSTTNRYLSGKTDRRLVAVLNEAYDIPAAETQSRTGSESSTG